MKDNNKFSEEGLKESILKNTMGYIEGYEAGKSEAISNFAEKIKDRLRHFSLMRSSFVIREINKLVEEQSSGERK